MSQPAFDTDAPVSVYFIACPSVSLVKIGVTGMVENRLRNMMAWAPVPLVLEAAVPGTWRDENFLHYLFRDEWSHFEWFDRSAALAWVIGEAAHDGVLPPFAKAPMGWKRQNLPHQYQPQNDMRRGAAISTGLKKSWAACTPQQREARCELLRIRRRVNA